MNKDKTGLQSDIFCKDQQLIGCKLAGHTTVTSSVSDLSPPPQYCNSNVFRKNKFDI